MTKPFDDPKNQRRRTGWIAALRNNFLAGLVVVVPVAITMWLIWTFVGWIDSWVLPFVPNRWHPDVLLDRWFGEQAWYIWVTGGAEVEVNVRGVGVVLFLMFTMLVGWIAKGFIGRSMIRYGESLVDRMPIVRSLYSGIKQIAETVFAQSQEAKFDTACLVEYPRKGIWAIAFVSIPARGEINGRAGGDKDLISVFLPTTPNPTSGFLLFVPRDDLIYLEMSVEDAAKLVISAGLVYPNSKDPAVPPAQPVPEAPPATTPQRAAE